jgi:hypothetical protein
MKKSWLKYLWLLGFLGILGFFTSNKGFFGFFGFFGFLGLSLISSDERLEANINKAARNAFVSGIFVFIAAIIYSAFAADLSIFAYAFLINFALQIVVFVVSLRIYDRMGG